ncbi:glycosyltransferase [Chelativorans sp. M5D2P16]|uniref:glycosyltransferase n=1 Tax=Chelativorans sp. M5D2P16 TaxID=3095678 RepID=UPI002ACAFB47|nr:glycosyltransferase [Chelativorans sp. M5D2P16]MDZ5698896.1 glycosyltransferase [Chelativorans sp. M5D2P16]
MSKSAAHLTLKDRPLPKKAARGGEAAASRRLSILFLTTVLPGEGRAGGEIVSAHVIEALRTLGHDVRVLGYARTGYVPGAGEMLVETRAIETRGAAFSAVRWLAQAFARRTPYSAEKYVGGSYLATLEQALSERRWDRVILDHAQMGWLLPRLDGQDLIHVSHNCEGLLYAGQARHGNVFRRAIFTREARMMEEVERRLALRARSVWTLTEAQAHVFREMGASSVTVLPVPPMPLADSFRLPEPDCDIALLGTWSWGPNRAGLDWFCQEVVPLAPSLRIRVGGTGAEDLRGRFEGIEIAGRVPDAAAFLASARVIAVPSTAGDGIQIKSLDAIAIGRPVVATPFALRGIDGLPPRVKSAETPRAFAAALREALEQSTGDAADDWQAKRRETFRGVLESALA